MLKWWHWVLFGAIVLFFFFAKYLPDWFVIVCAFIYFQWWISSLVKDATHKAVREALGYEYSYVKLKEQIDLLDSKLHEIKLAIDEKE